MLEHSAHFSKSCQIEEAKWKNSLPHEILIDIVLRLPIKSIITLTSVSKSLNSLIKSLYFISTHLNHTKHSYNHNHTPLLLLRKHSMNLWNDQEEYSLNWDNEAFDEYKRFKFPFHGLRAKILSLVGTCNGLVCLANPYNIFVWNPCIRKYVTLPIIPNIVWNPYIKKYVTGFDRAGVFIGFGFDSNTNDYKVVRAVTHVDTGGWGECTPEVDVYSLAWGKWNMVTALPPTCAIRKPGPQAFVNGALHWPVLRSTKDGFHNFVLVFDLGDEDFCEIMLPKDLLIDDQSFDVSVSVCGESLAAFCTMNAFNCIHVWMMKEYGVLESWTKVLTVGPQGPGVDVLGAVGFRKSGEIVIETEAKKLVSIDSESKKIKDLRIRGYGFAVDPYLESLVLLDKSEDAVSYKVKSKKWKNRQDAFNTVV